MRLVEDACQLGHLRAGEPLWTGLGRCRLSGGGRLADGVRIAPRQPAQHPRGRTVRLELADLRRECRDTRRLPGAGVDKPDEPLPAGPVVGYLQPAPQPAFHEVGEQQPAPLRRQVEHGVESVDRLFREIGGERRTATVIRQPVHIRHLIPHPARP